MLQKCSHVFADIITIVVTIYYSIMIELHYQIMLLCYYDYV